MEYGDGIYDQDQRILIRTMEKRDIPRIAEGFRLQSWNKPAEQFAAYYRQQTEGSRCVLIAECDHRFAGYVTLLPKALSGPFAEKNIPEIMDFNVLIRYRRQDIGSLLMDAVETQAAAMADAVSIGVGLYTDYGSAQRMYVKRGYIPDGSGVWSQNSILPPYQTCRNDDDLVLCFSKILRR